MSVLFNEIDPFAAEWLGNLYPGSTIDRRSIALLQPEDCLPHERVHFFAGIGGWELALDLAGWPAGVPVWTGSCPCQPFSSAGKRGGEKDERHLWPEMFRLVRECQPPVAVGEQVASSDGLGWLDGVFADLESEGYACWACDLCAAGIGAPHLRQRLFWGAVRLDRFAVGDAARLGFQASEPERRHCEGLPSTGDSGPDGRVVHPGRLGLQRRGERGDLARPGGDDPGEGHQRERGGDAAGDSSAAAAGRVEYAAGDGWLERWTKPVGRRPFGGRGEGGGLVHPEHGGRGGGNRESLGESGAPELSGVSNPWHPFTIIPRWHPRHGWQQCRAPAEPGLQPLAHGIPPSMGRGQPRLAAVARSARRNRTGRLKGYGNAIVPPLAAIFIRAFLDEAGL